MAALDSRDLVVLVGLAGGRSTAQIAAGLGVSRNTARTRIRRVKRKLGVEDRSGALRVASQLGIIVSAPRNGLTR